ncbi:inositol monophosphatase family protein [Nocardia flavorosea]|uniref:inositol-phosphate phosphatase n=1 Tax=Nocardia flavorosea TaxID=53429 RepID=A0A846YMM1_9NOCA|nr:hypothetical protein [Nocardia flavorosea]
MRNGDPVAGWILVPETGQLYVAEHGSGAFRNGALIRRTAPPAEVERLQGAAPTKRMSQQERAQLAEVGGRFATLTSGALSAGVNYTRMLDGGLDFVLYQRSLPWDHAAGVLLLAEAGGVTVRPDGSPYRPTESQNGLLLNAADETCCQAVQAVLWGELRDCGRSGRWNRSTQERRHRTDADT